MLLLRVRSAGG